MKRRKTWREWRRISLVMVTALLLGVTLLLVSSLLLQEWPDWKFFLNSFGVAFVIAGILGLTIDRLFRQQLAEDAFKASIGYILPDELKGEMEWIYGSHIICTQHIQRCELYPIDDETCIIHVDIQRKFRNISRNRSLLKLGVAIDEWFHKTGSSRILSFGYSKASDSWPKEGKGFSITKGECSIIVEEQEVSLAPLEETTLWYEIEEVKRTNDVQSWVFQYPTLNPQVTVKAYEGIAINAGFGYRLPAEQLSVGTYRLTGTLLAGQRMEIRWWEKANSERWLSDDQKTT